MLNLLKKYFFPHPENDHRPHLLHRKNTRLILGLVIVLELLVFALPTLTFTDRVEKTNLASVLPAVLSTLTNKERAQNDAPELVISPVLTQAAELKAKHMAENEYFAHTSPDGKSPWYWLDQVGYEYSYAGENLAINFNESKDVTRAWMDSPSHRANIIKDSYTEVGTGVATGYFEGEKTIFVAQIYANPREREVVTVPVEQTETEETTELAQEVGQETGNVPSTVLGVEFENDHSADANISAQPEVSLPEYSDSSLQPTPVQEFLSSPRHISNYFLIVILSIVFVVVALSLFYNVMRRHVDLVTNGLFVVTIILAILIANNFVIPKDVTIGQTIDYSKAQVIDGAI